jgi:glycolate oxidase iron-sulfur subunit
MIQELSNREQEKVTAIGERTLDVCQFLDKKIGLEQGTFHTDSERISLTYHDPCHLKKSLGVSDQPRAIIQANPRYQLREMVEADWCCGCGGSFNLENYEISTSIGKRKIDNIKSSGCGVVATGCPACMLQISEMQSQGGDRIQVKHSVEIYAEMLARVGMLVTS